MASTATTRRAEWRAHGPLVLAAVVGYAFQSIAPYSVGLFIEPLQRDFGWSRTEVSAGVTLAAMITAPLLPFVGALVDRWGVRRLALPGLVLTSVAIASLGLANGSVVQWLALWAAYALAQVLISQTIWVSAVTRRFSAGRSLALGLALTGGAVATICAPPLAQWLTDNLGWRQGFLWLGIGWGAPALVLNLLFLVDARDSRGRATHGASGDLAPEPRGLTLMEAARSPALIRIAVATLGTLLITTSLIVHKVPILTEAGVPRRDAALLASLSGVAAIAGQIATGWLMEKFDAGWVAAATNTAMAITLLLLLAQIHTPALIVASMLVVGYAGGTKLQICAYLTGIYGGMRNFGKIFGVMAMLLSFGGGLGPVLGGLAHDLAGNYRMLLMIGAPLSLVFGLLLIGLGPKPDWRAAPLGAGEATPAPRRKADVPA